MKKTLIIITRNYPVGTEESSFLPQELEILEKYYKIILLPKFFVRELGISDCKYPIEECDCNISIWDKVKYIFLSAIDIRLWKEVKLSYRKKIFSMSFFKQALADMVMSKNLDRVINKIVKDNAPDNEIIFYSYWYDYSLLSTTRYSKKYKTVTRAHGFDLYDERCVSGYQCYKEQMNQNISNVIFISNYGKEYYCKKYAGGVDNTSKYIVNYLGVKQQEFIPYQKHDVFKLISCSSVIPLKRIDKIIESLAQIDDFKIEWTHIGDGTNMDNISQLAIKLLKEKENIEYHFTGNLPNYKVMDLYRSNYYDCFILLSETEGLPVCIMEANSFGIPVIANHVGGINEIVNENNGYLLSTYQDANEVARAIGSMYYHSSEEQVKLRENAYLTWEKSFNSTQNAKRLAELLA